MANVLAGSEPVAKMKPRPVADDEMLKRINTLQNKCQATLARCEQLGRCNLDLDEERQQCEEQLAILAALKRELFPDAQ